MVGDVMAELSSMATFDLILANAEGGKCHGLDLTINSPSPGGRLVLDDLVAQDWAS
jgi:hypothetical protein